MNGDAYRNLSRKHHTYVWVPLENLLCRCAAPKCFFSGAGEGIRTPDPLITNQMLYQLSYASGLGQCPSRSTYTTPSDPQLMSRTILEGIITAFHVQTTRPSE